MEWNAASVGVSALLPPLLNQAVSSDAHCILQQCRASAEQVIGTISGSGKIVLKDKNQAPSDPIPVDLDLEKVLGDMPRKTYSFNRRPAQLESLDLPEGTQPRDALRQVLKLPSVHSKRFLTTKVDRCVTGVDPSVSVQNFRICLSKPLKEFHSVDGRVEVAKNVAPPTRRNLPT